MNALHPATLMDTNMVVSAGIEPRTSVMEGRDPVLLLINGDTVGRGQFYRKGQPGRTRNAQPYDADSRARLRQASEWYPGGQSLE